MYILFQPFIWTVWFPILQLSHQVLLHHSHKHHVFVLWFRLSLVLQGFCSFSTSVCLFKYIKCTGTLLLIVKSETLEVLLFTTAQRWWVLCCRTRGTRHIWVFPLLYFKFLLIYLVCFFLVFLFFISLSPRRPLVWSVLSLAAALSQEPVGRHLSFALDLDVSSEFQLEAVELQQDVASRRWHVDLQCCTNTGTE